MDKHQPLIINYNACNDAANVKLNEDRNVRKLYKLHYTILLQLAFQSVLVSYNMCLYFCDLYYSNLPDVRVPVVVADEENEKKLN